MFSSDKQKPFIDLGTNTGPGDDTINTITISAQGGVTVTGPVQNMTVFVNPPKQDDKKP